MNKNTDYFYLIAKCAVLESDERKKDTTFADILKREREQNRLNFYESIKNRRHR